MLLLIKSNQSCRHRTVMNELPAGQLPSLSNIEVSSSSITASAECSMWYSVVGIEYYSDCKSFSTHLGIE